jgi:hypothetical protein
MREKTYIDAIDHMIAQVPRLKGEFWVKHGLEVNNNISGLSAGERRVYDVCLSFWDGSRSVDLREFAEGVSPTVFLAFIEAAMLLYKDM